MKMHYDERNDHIYCINAYTCKETLKAMGFKWNPIGGAWFIACPKDMTEMGNLICDVAVDCKMGYIDLCEFASEIYSVKGEYTMDDAHMEKFQTAMSGIWYDQIDWEN